MVRIVRGLTKELTDWWGVKHGVNQLAEGLVERAIEAMSSTMAKACSLIGFIVKVDLWDRN